MGNGGDSSSDVSMLDTLKASGMYGILPYNSAVQNHSALLAWMLGDEPDNYGTPVSQVQSDSAAIKAADPNHLVTINFSCGFYWDSSYNWIPSGLNGSRANYVGYEAAADIVGFDMYPVTGWDAPQWLYVPGAATAKMVSDTQSKKPVFPVIEASKQDLSWTPPNTPGPTAQEMRFEAWDCIIHGATGLGYFTIAFNPFRWTNYTADIEAEMTRTNSQINALKDVILSDPPAMSVTASEASGKKFNFMTRQSGSTYYVFVDNADMGRASESITIRFGQSIGSVSVYGENRQITPSGSAFTDSFSPIDIHIYQVTLSGSAATPTPTPTPKITPTPTPIATPTPVPSGGGLVAAYSFNETSGSTVSDASGNNNVGTITNATRANCGAFWWSADIQWLECMGNGK